MAEGPGVRAVGPGEGWWLESRGGEYGGGRADSLVGIVEEASSNTVSSLGCNMGLPALELEEPGGILWATRYLGFDLNQFRNNLLIEDGIRRVKKSWTKWRENMYIVPAKPIEYPIAEIKHNTLYFLDAAL